MRPIKIVEVTSINLATKQKRKEYIDVRENHLFQNCRTLKDIKKAYTRFWGGDVLAVRASRVDGKSFGIRFFDVGTSF